jgi:hypothetical protein
MRKLTIDTDKYTQVYAVDIKSAGNANHEYEIQATNAPAYILQEISFQNGPIKEVGVNGVMNEDLISIVIDRLQGFQSGDFKCRENEMALIKLEEALMWLRKRTNDRESRGVEGTSVI